MKMTIDDDAVAVDDNNDPNGCEIKCKEFICKGDNHLGKQIPFFSAVSFHCDPFN